jgi:hypothetical protein
MGNLFKDLSVDIKQDYLNVDNTVAISSEGSIFKVGDTVYHEGSEIVGEVGIIEKLYWDKDTCDVMAKTDKGIGRISFLYTK